MFDPYTSPKYISIKNTLIKRGDFDLLADFLSLLLEIQVDCVKETFKGVRLIFDESKAK